MRKTRVLLGSGLLSLEQVHQIRSCLTNSEIVAVIGDQRKKKDDTGVFSGKHHSEKWTRIHFTDLIAETSLEKQAFSVKKITQFILADPNAYLIAERCMIGGYFASTARRLFKIETIVFNTLKIISELQVERFVQTNIPHNLDWFLAKVFEALKLEVFYTRVCSPLDRVQLVSGVSKPSKLKIPMRMSENDAADLTNSVFSALSQNYDKARPNYENENIKERGKNLLSLKSVLADIRRINSLAKGIWITKNIIKKIKRFIEHSACVKEPNKKTPLIKFFLHYQPEATTIPAGCWYANQNNAVRELFRAASGVCLVGIREHPSTFRLTFDSRYRWPGFYKTLSSDTSVVLLKIESDVFSEFRNCKAVATVTGNVGFEAVCRGIPCILFADTFYSNLEGVFNVGKEEITKNNIKKIVKTKINQKKLKKDVKRLISESFKYEKEINGSLEALVYLCDLN